MTRVEGHLRVEFEHEGGRVTAAWCSGTLARGLELIFRGRDPRDIPILAQRICGVCPQAHATASALALDEAFGLAGRVPPNGVLLRGIMLGAEFLQSHVLHFYHLALLDYVDVRAAAGYGGADPGLCAMRDAVRGGGAGFLVSSWDGDRRLAAEEDLEALRHYLRALDVRRACHELGAIFGGKMPHQCTVNVGGVTTQATRDKAAAAFACAREAAEFVEECYVPDVMMLGRAYRDGFAMGRGCSRFLSYGVAGEGSPFGGGLVEPGAAQVRRVDVERITEDVTHARYDGDEPLHPALGRTVPEPDKQGAYSWLKAPRYDGAPCEVGPLARLMVACRAGAGELRTDAERMCAEIGVTPADLDSTMGRHIARALEARQMARLVQDWIAQLSPDEPCSVPAPVPAAGEGAGLTDAPRGALGHWIGIEGGLVSRYQAVVPTTWNGSPRDAAGTPGPIEQALEGLPLEDIERPLEVLRTVRSFDPCLACSVHAVRARPARTGRRDDQ